MNASSPARPRALVVDDVSAERERISSILRDAGWQVQTAASGHDALVHARATPPNIIFLDIVMPQMDGFETCRRLSEDPATRAIPVVFVSSKSQRADQLWARMQGGKEVLGKPYTEAQVLEALRHAV